MKKFFKLVSASILLASSFILNAQDFAKGTLIVKFAPEVKPFAEKGSFTTGIESIDKLASKYGIKEANELFKNYKPVKSIREVIIQGKTVKVPSLANIYKLTLDENADVLKAVKDYSNMPGVVYAEPDYIAHSCATPNDTYFGEQWGLTKIQAEAAWDTTTGDSSVVIGILDTGIDTAHPDIVNNLWVNKDEIPNNSIDDDGNSFIDDVYGWNFVSNNNNPNDDAGHGTHCAGIAGAVTNNSAGVAGVSWKSKVMAVKVLNNNGTGLYSNIALGIVYAAANNAKVINMSLGGYASSVLLENALINAYATSVPVAAAGNDNKEQLFYPACLSTVIAVAATDSLDIKWDGSNYGSWVDLSAPGVGIYNTRLNDYARFTGTSQAAPFVSGVAALIAAHKPGFSTGAIMNMIVNNTESIDTLNPTYAGKIGNGRLNARLALTGNLLPILAMFGDTIKDPAGDNDGVPDAGETVNLVITLQDNGMDATSVSAILHTDDADITVTDSTAGFGTILAREKKANSGDVFTFSLSGGCPQHNALFRLEITSNSGAYRDTIEFSIGTQNTFNVSGMITTNTLWTKDKLYIVTNPVIVQSGVTLTIEPGTEIRVKSGKMIRIDGELIAKGDSADTIKFTSNDTIPKPGSWYGIRFTNSATDALYDSSGNYLSGSILEYCSIQYAGPAINYDSTSLFIHKCLIANNFRRDSAISSSSYGGGIALSYSGGVIKDNSIINNKVKHIGGAQEAYGGGIGGQDVLTLTISGNIIDSNKAEGDWLSSGSGGGIYLSMRMTAGNTLKLTGNTIINNSGGSNQSGSEEQCNGNGGPEFTFYNISNNYIGNNIGSVDGGAIMVWGGFDSLSKVSNNLVENNLGNGIVFINGASGIISNCRIINNKSYGVCNIGSINNSIICVDSNVIAGNDSGGIKVTTSTGYRETKEIKYNTIINNSGPGIKGEKINEVHHNNILWNTGYDFKNTSSVSMVADSNWWGTTNTDTIDEHIWDMNDDPMNIGLVTYTTLLTSPDRAAPPYLDSVQIYPEPAGIETLYTHLTFSKPMDTTVAPVVTFGIDTNLTQYEVSGKWADLMHWNGNYSINEMVVDSTYRIQVAGACDSAFVIPIDTRHTFRVYTAGSASRELIAGNIVSGVKLSWHHSSIANLLGYNIYRDTLSGGNYELINSTVITDTAYNDTTMPLGKISYYVYTILDNNFNESSYSSEASCFVGVEENSIPKVFALSSPNPNPFTNHTTLMYQIPATSKVSLRLYDLTGRCVKALVDGEKVPGYYKVDLKSKDYPAGIYFAKFAAGSYKETKKLVLMK
ncbi:MAG: S8 family serine peptidase [bacterium]|nr:S8 family serine peptidase [bacterium]